MVVASTADYAALNHSLAPTQSQPNRRKLSTLVWTKSRYRARIRDTTNTTIMCEGGTLLPSQKTTRSRNSEIEFCWRRQTDNCSTGRPLSHEFFKVLILPFQLCIVDSFSISGFTVRQELILYQCYQLFFDKRGNKFNVRKLATLLLPCWFWHLIASLTCHELSISSWTCSLPDLWFVIKLKE